MKLETYEHALWQSGLTQVAGVDEAGRGPLAGPVVAAAVIFEPHSYIEGVNDSKKLTAIQREKLFDLIHSKARSIGIGTVSHEKIDQMNILQASMYAMECAVSELPYRPEHLLIDGNTYRDNAHPYTTVVGGDSRCFCIAAASIIAKVTRDRLMMQYHEQFPEYGFAKHKGYGTRQHIEAIRKYGPCEIHRKSFHVTSLEATNGRE